MSTTIDNSSNIPLVTTTTGTTTSSTQSSTTDSTTFANALAAASSVAPTTLVNTTTSATSSSTPSLLTTSADSSANRPDMKQFMDATGANADDASELLYGVIGSNTDTRNWSAIMSSADPITATRQATAAMYGNNTPNSDAATNINSQSNGLVAQSGDFALQQTLNKDGSVNHTGVDLVDNTGTILRDAGSTPDQIQRNAWLFGLDLNKASSLVQQTQQLSSPLGDALSQAIAQTNAANVPVTAPNTTNLQATVSTQTVSTPTVQAQTSTSSTANNTAVAAVTVPTTPVTDTTSTTSNNTTATPTVDSLTTQINKLSGTLANSTPTNLNSYLSLVNQIQTLTTQLQALQASNLTNNPNTLIS